MNQQTVTVVHLVVLDFRFFRCAIHNLKNFVVNRTLLTSDKESVDMNQSRKSPKTVGTMSLIAILMGSMLSVISGSVAANAAGVWTERTAAGAQKWKAIASSADGKKLAAVSDIENSTDGLISTSTDSGATWTKQTSAGRAQWRSIASNADGTKLAAVSYRGAFFSPGKLFTSTDSGITWTEQTSAGTGFWRSIASSADGTKLAAVKYLSSVYEASSIYTSTDSGVTWTEQTGAGKALWQSIASSADGTKLVAASYYKDISYGPGAIYTSADSGVTWTEQTSAGSAKWSGVASSADGTKLFATAYNSNDGAIYTSTDSGATWTEQTSAGKAGWAGISASADGTKLAAVSDVDVAYNPGSVFTSVDSGVTWTQETAPGAIAWSCVVVSSDGNLIATAASYLADFFTFGSIWTNTAPLAPAFSASTPSIPNTYYGSTSATQTETITNTGTSNLVFGAGAVTLTGTNSSDFSILADNCSSQTVIPNGTCTVTYTFRPAASGSRTANLVFASNVVGSPSTVVLSAVSLGAITIRKIDDSYGSVRGGTTVVITGTGFNSLALVTIDGYSATVTKRKGSTSITVRTPAHAEGKVLVTVTNPDTGFASYNGFTYKADPPRRR